MDLLCIFGFAALGGIVSGMIALAIPNAPFGARIAVELIGIALGVLCGYLVLLQGKKHRLEELAEMHRRQQKANPTPPQIVGSKCVQCSKSIMFIVDAHVCRYCNTVICRECAPELPCSTCAQKIRLKTNG